MATIIGDKTYTHTQLAPALIWAIQHELDKHPSVDCFSGDGESIVGKIVYTGMNSLTITFSENVLGKAYLN